MKTNNLTDGIQTHVDEVRRTVKELRITAETEGLNIKEMSSFFLEMMFRLKELLVISVSENVWHAELNKGMDFKDYIILRENVVEELYDAFSLYSKATELLLTSLNFIAASKKEAEGSLSRLCDHIADLRKERSLLASGAVDPSKIYEISIAIDDAMMNYKAGGMMIHTEISNSKIDEAIAINQTVVRQIISLIAFNEAMLRQYTKMALAIGTAYALYAAD